MIILMIGKIQYMVWYDSPWDEIHHNEIDEQIQAELILTPSRRGR